MSPLRLIGYWPGAPLGQRWPHPRDFVRPDWDLAQRAELAWYLEHGVLIRTLRHRSPYLLCGEPQPSEELSDLRYVWPRSLVHYVAEHAVRPPTEFLEHCMAASRRLEALEIDMTWWRSQASPTA